MGRLIAELHSITGRKLAGLSANPSKSVSALNEKGGTNIAPKVFGLDQECPFGFLVRSTGDEKDN